MSHKFTSDVYDRPLFQEPYRPNSRRARLQRIQSARLKQKRELKAKRESESARRLNELRAAVRRPASRYQAYLQSQHWRSFRLSILAKRGARCEQCGSAKNVNLHHLSYARLGRELDGDVKILCRSCHEQTHEVIQDPQSLRERLTRGRLDRQGQVRATPATPEILNASARTSR